MQRPQRKRKRHFIGTWPEVMLSAGMEGEVNVTLSGRNIAVSTRMMATVDTVTIWVRVDTLPEMIELRKRPMSIISQ